LEKMLIVQIGCKSRIMIEKKTNKNKKNKAFLASLCLKKRHKKE